VPDDSNPQIIRAPDQIVGYHGCELSTARRLLAGDPFRLSANDYDWLGSGVYFWEYAPFRAQGWARQRFGDNWAVLQATISLGDCLNLLDTDYFEDLQAVHSELMASLDAFGLAPPANRRGANRLDRMIIDRFSQVHQGRGGHFDTVRGSFQEGQPIFAGSQLYSQSHVQIAVRNIDCIQTLHLVNYR